MKKSTTKKAAPKRKPVSRGAKKKAAAPTRAKKTGTKTSAKRSVAKKGTAVKRALKRAVKKVSPAKKKAGTRKKTSPVARVKRVAAGIVEQVSHAADQAATAVTDFVADRF